MKKTLILAAIASVALAGCTSLQEEGPKVGTQEISFANPVTVPNTRAAYPGEIGQYPKTESFRVFAVKTPAFSQWQDADLYMENIKCSYRTEGNTFVPAPKYYWPKDGDKLTFAAYSPATLNLNTKYESGHYCLSYAKNGLQLTGFTTPANGYSQAQATAEAPVENTQYDVLFSDRTIDQESSTTKSENNPYNGVDLVFHHALSSIQFTIKQAAAYEDVDLFVNSISLHNIASVADFNENIADSEQAAKLNARTQKPVWSNFDVKKSFNGFAVAPRVALSTEVKSMSDLSMSEGKSLILIPQKFENNAAEFSEAVDPYIQVVWTMKNADGKEYVTTTKKPLSEIKFLTAAEKEAGVEASAEWKMGYRYIYNIIISLDEIFFNPIVNPWENIQVGGKVEI